MWKERSNLDDDPLIFAINTVRNINTPTGKYINDFLNSHVPADETLLEKVREQIRANNNSRCMVYKEMNPGLVVHSLYKQKHVINEFHRVCFTRFRVSGHSLAVETGRWNRRGRGRLPIEERTCICGEIQTERHVAQECTLTQNIRETFNFNLIEDIFSSEMSPDTTCKIIHDILKTYN